MKYNFELSGESSVQRGRLSLTPGKFKDWLSLEQKSIILHFLVNGFVFLISTFWIYFFPHTML